MKPEPSRCPHCGLLHPAAERACPVTGEPLPSPAPRGTEGPIEGVAARLIITIGESRQVCPLRAQNSLGRHPGNSIQILDKIVSKEHCRVEQREGRFVLCDLGSLNGTFVNNVRVRGEMPLSDGDEITLGATRAVFRTGAAEPREAPRVRAAPGSVDLQAERLLAHLATDRPVYQPGETLFARAAVLDAFTRAPCARVGTLGFEVRSPAGDAVLSRPAELTAGIAPFSWAIPADLPGGDYILYARCPAESFAPAELGFAVRACRAPRLDGEIELAGKAYGPGEEVTVRLTMRRAEGGVPAGAIAVVTAVVDGIEVHRAEAQLDALGAARVAFRLPERIDEGEGTITAFLRDGGVAETIAAPIPLALQRVRVALYPEGGDLVVGLPARLYVEARTHRGKPAAVAGRIVDAGGEVLARFRTEHEGRGVVAFTPGRSGRAYMAVLDEPRGVTELFPLPEVERDGITLGALDDVTAPDEPVRLRITAASRGRVRVALHVREREVAAQRLDLAAGEAREVALTPPGSADGVLRATVTDIAGLPRAERLVFRRPLRALRVTVEPIPGRASTRAPVKVRVRTHDADGRPVSATVTLVVVDGSVLEAIERRERAPRLLEQALLGGEVLELTDAGAYLADAPEAARRLDLLLGTQGFRRFAFHDVPRFLADHGDRAARVLARRRPPAPALAQTAALVEPSGVAPAPPPVAAPPVAAPLVAAPPAPAAPQGAPAPRPNKPALVLAVSAPPRGRRVVAGRPAILPPGPVVVVREYAHRVVAAADARTDFAETLYWNAGITTPPSGEIEVGFDLSDAVTTFRVRADVVGADGALGLGDAGVGVRRPFHVDPRLPLEVSVGDVIDLPVTLVNGTAARLDAQITLAVGGPLIASPDPLALALGPEGRGRVVVPLLVGPGQGTFPVELRAVAGVHEIEVKRAIAVASAGYPAAIDRAGRLVAGVAAVHRIHVPEAMEVGSLDTEVVLYRGPVAALAPAFGAASPELPATYLTAMELPKQDADGAVRGEVATTALAILGWLAGGRPEEGEAADWALAWLEGRAEAGCFGATPATALALKAIVAGAAARPGSPSGGAVKVLVDGAVRSEGRFGAEPAGPIVLPSFAGALGPGEHAVVLLMEGGASLPYSLHVGWATPLPASAPACALALVTSLSRDEVPEGAGVDLRIELTNTAGEAAPLVTAIVGVPAGIEPRTSQLTELVAQKKIDAWEIRGREVILYRREMAAGERVALALSMVAAIPGSFAGPASRAYRYFTAEAKVWAAPLRVRVIASR